jgi:hypothetical protein
MSLWEVDTVNIDRSDPQLHSRDVSMEHKALGTHSIAPRGEGSTTTAKLTQKNDRILINDGTVDRAIIGRNPDGKIAIIVSKPGIDVNSLFS